MVLYLSKYYHQQSPCSAIFVCRVRILLSFSDIKSSIFLIFISRIFQIDLDLDYFPSLSNNQIILNQVTSIVSLISPMVQSFSQIISSCYCCLSPFWNLFLVHKPINQLDYHPHSFFRLLCLLFVSSVCAVIAIKIRE